MNPIRQGVTCLLVGLTCLGWGTVAESYIPSIPAIANPSISILARKPAPIPTVSIGQLPPQVKTTLDLIQQGGPFPYKKDGTIFSNREKRLPIAPTDYYREYTVPTPGISGRGARRLVTGQRTEVYYTQDHYRSFVRVQR